MPITQYCWRCKIDVPMLTVSEWEEVSSMISSQSISLAARHAMLLNEYERITGFRETNPNAIYHHVTSHHGDPCKDCGKPLRTPRAGFCAACGSPKG